VPYTTDINSGQFNFFNPQLKVTGSGLVATVLFRSRHSEKVVNVIHFCKLCFVIFQLIICNMHCSFRGFILAYKDLEIVTDTVTLKNDDPYIHLDIVADFYIFTPSIGCTLFGE
jgi:hypothetical protein